ncbi:MAG: polyisoprenoid-binding protein [Alphaproteobacteria bacterium]|nr:polyisoprenoid-binding protein [Alphaproteobacteria bacterium]
MRRLLLPLALATAVVPALAQDVTLVPGTPEASRVRPGTYEADSDHTQVAWSVNHFGISAYHGLFGAIGGRLSIDPSRPADAALSVTIPIAKVVTTSDELDVQLRSASFFDAERFPTATFISTRITVKGTAATIEGNLTLHGVTKPVALNARFTGVGDHPMKKVPTIGFEATTSIKRSDFGISKYVPLVGDQVELSITAAFDRQG